RTDYDAGNTPGSLSVADFDGDGFLDIAVGDRGVDGLGNVNISILPGLTGGAFAPLVAINPNIGPINGLAPGDLNANGSPGLVVAAVGGLEVLDNTSTPGTFAFTPQLPLSTQATNSVAIGFIDYDNQPDIVASANFPGGVIDVYQNQGLLSFFDSGT